jgi:hypothetical protein
VLSRIAALIRCWLSQHQKSDDFANHLPFLCSKFFMKQVSFFYGLAALIRWWVNQHQKPDDFANHLPFLCSKFFMKQVSIEFEHKKASAN